MGECFSHAFRKTPLKIRQSIFLRRLDFFQGKNLVDVIAVLDIRIYVAWLDAQGNVVVSFVAQPAAGGFGDKMTRDAIQKIICEGENSHIEFKSEAVSNEELAIAMIAFSNGQGGVILLGVEDDGQISGISGMPDKKMNAVNQICQNTVKPPIIPTLDAYSFDERIVLAISIEKGIQKPYYLLKQEKTLFYIRVGTTCRLASPEQIAVLYSSHPIVHYDVAPLPDMLLEYLDERRIRHYFSSVKKLPEKYYRDQHEQLCLMSRIAMKLAERTVATVAGGLLFGREPSQFIPSAGIRCVAFDGVTMDYAMRDSKFLDMPLLPYAPDGVAVEYGLIEHALQFIEQNTRTATVMQGIQRISIPEYPREALREVMTNALVHRDYALHGGQIRLLLFADRLEVRSPGKLPNTLTLDMIKTGASYARNPVLMKFAENYGYVEHLGLGIPEKVIRPMRDAGHPEPEFLDDGYEFVVILRKKIEQ